MATAKRRALDHLRRGKMLARKHGMLALDVEREQEAMPDFDAALDDDIGDEMLRLVFTACHPLLSREASAALALRMICGLTTEEIARAFLVPEATISQRIVRAKRTLSESGLAYETPRGEALSERLASVLEVVYLIFNEGYTASRGDDWMRPQLCHEALRMGRVLVSIAPREPEAHGLLALMELNGSRAAARDRCGRRAHPAAGTGSQALGSSCRSVAACGAVAGARARRGESGFYALQAEIVACHAACGDGRSHRLAAHRALYAEAQCKRCARRSSSSTARWRSAWPTGRRPDLRSSKPSRTSRR